MKPNKLMRVHKFYAPKNSCIYIRNSDNIMCSDINILQKFWCRFDHSSTLHFSLHHNMQWCPERVLLIIAMSVMNDFSSSSQYHIFSAIDVIALPLHLLKRATGIFLLTAMHPQNAVHKGEIICLGP